MGRRKLTEEEKAEREKIKAEKYQINYMWQRIFHYVEKDVLGYDDNQHLQKNAVLRIKGLQSGKVMANNKTESNGNYPLEVVLGAVYMAKDKHILAKKYKHFETEEQELAYFCAIVRNQLNTVYAAWKKKEHYKNATEAAIRFKEEHKGAKYKPKPYNPVSNAEELW